MCFANIKNIYIYLPYLNDYINIKDINRIISEYIGSQIQNILSIEYDHTIFPEISKIYDCNSVPKSDYSKSAKVAKQKKTSLHYEILDIGNAIGIVIDNIKYINRIKILDFTVNDRWQLLGLNTLDPNNDGQKFFFYLPVKNNRQYNYLHNDTATLDIVYNSHFFNGQFNVQVFYSDSNSSNKLRITSLSIYDALTYYEYKHVHLTKSNNTMNKAQFAFKSPSVPLLLYFCVLYNATLHNHCNIFETIEITYRYLESKDRTFYKKNIIICDPSYIFLNGFYFINFNSNITNYQSNLSILMTSPKIISDLIINLNLKESYKNNVKPKIQMHGLCTTFYGNNNMIYYNIN